MLEGPVDSSKGAEVLGNQAPKSSSKIRWLDMTGMSVGLTEPGLQSHGFTSCDSE